MKKKPNIVLITIDSLRADFVGFLNKKENNTPFLDKFAKKSITFTNAISPANPTFFCFTSLMTGTLPFKYGKYLGIPENKKVRTIAQVLKNHGYQTTAILADSPALYSIYKFDKGFDFYDDGYEDASKLYLSWTQRLWNLRESVPDVFLQGSEIIRAMAKAVFLHPEISVTGETLNRKVMNHFKKKRPEPFFLWLHYLDVHLPYFSGLDTHFYKDKHIIERTRKKAVFYKELATSVRKMKIKNKVTTEIITEAYRASIKYMDDVLSEIVTFFQEKYPETVILIVSDHGEALMEHGMFGHEPFSLYDELLHIPLMIYVPGMKPEKISQTVSLVSIAKTLSSLAGIRKSSFQGNDIVKDKTFSPINNISRILYKCRAPHVRLGIFDNVTEITGYTELWSFTSKDEKYIVEKNGEREEYFNLKNDPFEKRNIRGEKEKKKKYKALLKKYLTD